MFKYLIGAVLFAMPAFAAYDHLPKPGDVVVTHVKMIVCDSKEQIAKIAKAGEDGDPGAVTEALKVYQAIKDAKGEPTCAYETIDGAIAGESADTGPSTAANGEKVQTFAVHIGTSEANAWMMAAFAFEGVQKERETDPGYKTQKTPDLCQGRSAHSQDGFEPRIFWCASDNAEEVKPDCTTLADVKAANKPDDRFVALTAVEFAKVIAHFAEAGQPAPDRVKSIVLGAVPDVPQSVWVFAFDSDKCETASFQFSADAMKAILRD